MAYKRYFYRKGKRFGPYYYESYRDKKGKVRKKYIGIEDPDKKVEKNIVHDKRIKEIINSNNNLKENIAKKSSNRATPINSSVGMLIFLIILLVLMNILFLFYYVRN